MNKISTEWIACKKCRQLWTPRSINEFGLCPPCHRKSVGIFDPYDEMKKIMEHYQDSNPDWDSVVSSMPANLQRDIYNIFNRISEERGSE